MAKQAIDVGSLTVLVSEHTKKKRKERDRLLGMIHSILMERRLEGVLETVIRQVDSNYKEIQNEDR